MYRRFTGGCGLLALATLALTACTQRGINADSDPTLRPTSSSSVVLTSPSVAPTVLTVTPATGAANISPTAEIGVAVTGGTLTSVTLASATGTQIKGVIADDGASWKPTEALEYNRGYTFTAVTANAAGAAATRTSTFTTVQPDNLTMPYIQTAAGSAVPNGIVFGVGQVIRVHFDETIPDRKAAQAALSVTTSPPQNGGWNWMTDRDVYWRSEVYLVTDTIVTITANTYGKAFGNGLYGQANAATSFKVGPKHVSIADDNTKMINVYENDQLIKQIPTSMGRHASITADNGDPIDLRTNSGPHLVVAGEKNIDMNSASFGLSKGDNAYRTVVPVGVRISYDGEYVHWADWSVWAQGNTDTSHGCLNVSPENAYWFYDFSQSGDIVDVVNTGRPLQVWNSGYWVDTFAQWIAGSAA